MKHIVCNGLIVGFILAASSAIHAQSAEPKGLFLNVNGGGQSPQRTITTSATFPLYDQTGSLAAAQNVGQGPIFDINGGYRLDRLVGRIGLKQQIWSKLSIGAGFTSYGKTGDLFGTAAVPHPLFANRAVDVPIDAQGKRTERSVYIQAVWFMPLSRFMSALDKFDLAFSLGPSFISVEQDVLVGVSVPAGTQDATANIERREDTKVGLLAGVDGSYLVTRNIGVGAFVRYHGAGSVDLSPAERQSTGGFQGGGGLRLRF
jgi:hypothetical protein